MKNKSIDRVRSSMNLDPDSSIVLRMKAWEENQENQGSFNHKCYHYMFTQEQINRRIKSAIKYEETAKTFVGYAGSNKAFAQLWAETSTLILKGGYDSVDSLNNVILAAAVWILDALSESGKLSELYPLVADACEYDHSSMIPLRHPSYDMELIWAVANVICHRNDDLYDPDGFQHNWADPWTVSALRTVPQNSKKRADFDAMMALIDDDAKKRAAKAYETKVWEFYRISLTIDTLLQKKKINLEKKVDELDRQILEANRFELNQLFGKNVFDIKPVLGPVMNPSPSKPEQKTSQDIKQLEIENARVCKELDDFTSVTLADLSSMAYVEEREKWARLWKKYIPEKLLDELIHFSVDDPFESSFGLLCLLEANSGIPWLYYGSMAVFYTIKDQLPYEKTLYAVDSLKHSEKTAPTGAKDPLYQMKYQGNLRHEKDIDADGDSVIREYGESIAQKVFSQTLCLIPRIRYSLQNPDNVFEELGATQIREVCGLLLQILLYKNESLASLDDYRIEQLFKEIEHDQNNDEENQDDSVEEIRRLKHQIDSLNRAYREEASKVSALQNERNQLHNEKELLRRELADLREIVFNKEYHPASDKKIKEEVSLPYIVKKRTVSFGGHESWLKMMKSFLPEVRFISPDMLPNTNLIRMADVVWIQPNCMSHADYYKIINIVREYNIQIRYYIYDSAEKCARQLAISDQN